MAWAVGDIETHALEEYCRECAVFQLMSLLGHVFRPLSGRKFGKCGGGNKISLIFSRLPGENPTGPTLPTPLSISGRERVGQKVT